MPPPVSHPAAGAPDEAAFDQLVRQHQQVVFAVALRMLGDRHEAEDVAQDTFVHAYRAWASFRREAKASTWLVAITLNLCRNRRRWWARRKRVVTASLDEPLQPGGEESLGAVVPAAGASPAEAAQQAEQRQVIAAALQALDVADREVLVLRELQGYAYEEIAEMLRVPRGTVKSRISRARLALRALLDGKVT